MTDYERGRAEALAQAVKVLRDQINRLTESLSEGLMTDAGLTGDDRKAMKAQLNCLGVFEDRALTDLRALSPSPEWVMVPREPTERMVQTGLDTFANSRMAARPTIEAVYRAMLSEVKE